jgi:hypothetical protein
LGWRSRFWRALSYRMVVRVRVTSEPAGFLHPPDVQLQVRPPGSQRVQAALGAPRQVTAQVGFGVLAGGALEAGQVGSHRQPQPVGERRRRIGGRWGQLGESRHALTLQRLAATVKLTNTHLAAEAGVPHAGRRCIVMRAG